MESIRGKGEDGEMLGKSYVFFFFRRFLCLVKESKGMDFIQLPSGYINFVVGFRNYFLFNSPMFRDY